MAWIAAQMNAQHIPTTWDRGIWHEQTIRKILANEKYIGDSLCQKTYTTNVFPYIRKDNKGQADQYYTENSHPAIIDREVFDRVQSLMRRRAERVKIPHSEYVLSQKIVCGACGTVFVRRSGKAASSHGDAESMIAKRQAVPLDESRKQRSTPHSCGCTTS
mgnify:CR=1 FL=1